MSLCLLISGLFLSWYGYSNLHNSSFYEANSQVGQVGIDLANAESSQSDSLVQMILVEAAGRVVQPGVYQVAATARVGDVLEKAGGLQKDADQNFISKDLNLAQAVSDGQKLYIPYEGEFAEKTALATADSSQNSPVGGSTEGKISVNSASLGELQTLKGIGAVRAEAIVAGRPYASIADLLENGVLGQAVFDGISDSLAL